MAYTNESMNIRIKYDAIALEWRWQVEARGSALNEFAIDAGSAATHTDALTAAGTAITNRLA